MPHLWDPHSASTNLRLLFTRPTPVYQIYYTGTGLVHKHTDNFSSHEIGGEIRLPRLYGVNPREES